MGCRSLIFDLGGVDWSGLVNVIECLLQAWIWPFLDCMGASGREVIRIDGEDITIIIATTIK